MGCSKLVRFFTFWRFLRFLRFLRSKVFEVTEGFDARLRTRMQHRNEKHCTSAWPNLKTFLKKIAEGGFKIQKCHTYQNLHAARSVLHCRSVIYIAEVAYTRVERADVGRVRCRPRRRQRAPPRSASGIIDLRSLTLRLRAHQNIER